jgi:hypothetical protein
LKVFQNEDVYAAPWYQQKLWHWYNATDNALNFIHLPTIAYSGEKDRQKQAADAMEAALRGENLDLLHHHRAWDGAQTAPRFSGGDRASPGGHRAGWPCGDAVRGAFHDVLSFATTTCTGWW